MRTIKLFILSAVMFFGANNVWSQAFSKGDITISVAAGATHYWHLRPNGNVWSPLSGNALVTMEFAPGRYVGAGFFVGFGGSAGGWYNNWNSLNMPIGGFANFHFYQLIADKTGKDIHADKLDIYAGLNLGSGIGIWPGAAGGARVSPLIYGGPTVGIRYYFTPSIAVNGELGYGKTLFSGGVTFKL